MKGYLPSGFILLLVFNFSSCDSDFQVIDETRSKPVVYCLLNPGDSCQYLRISRSFIVRSNPDSFVIHPDSLVLHEDFYAYLEFEKPNGTREINYFEPTGINRRDSGLFPQEGLVLLKSNCTVQGDKEYGLYINLPNVPRLIAGSVIVVNPVKILDPDPLPGREVTLMEDQGLQLRWTKSVKFAVYQSVISLVFLEGYKNFQVLREVNMPQPLVYGDSENAILTGFLNGAGFIDDLLSNLSPPDSGRQRKIIGFNLLITTGGPELSVYTRTGQNAIASYTGLEEYSNLDGATGIFSSRTITGSYNNRLSDLTINYLSENEKTKHLGFLKFNEDFHP